jgi:hypothetical protein
MSVQTNQYATLNNGTVEVDYSFDTVSNLILNVALRNQSGIPGTLLATVYTLDGGTVLFGPVSVGVQPGGSGAVSALSGGLSLPQGTIDIGNTSGFSSSGKVVIFAALGRQIVNFAGKTATALTGCTGGSAVLTAGDVVDQVQVTDLSGLNAHMVAMTTKNGTSLALPVLLSVGWQSS